MYIENNLSDEDMTRIAQADITPRAVAAAHVSLLEACDTVCQEIVIPLIKQDQNRPQRQVPLIVLFYRMLGFCQTAIRLQAAVHQQSLTLAERSVIELWIDMELLHRDVIPDGVDKIMAFVEYQKVKAARRTVRFFAQHPELDDETPSKAARHQAFIDAKADEINGKVQALWGEPGGRAPKPDHWSRRVAASTERMQV